MVRFTTRSEERTLAKLLTSLVDGKAGVSQFREVQQDLEDAFLSVTRQDAAAAAAAEAAAPVPVAPAIPAAGGSAS